VQPCQRGEAQGSTSALEDTYLTLHTVEGGPTEVADQVVQTSDSNGCRLCAVNLRSYTHAQARALMHAHAI
jgi:hypothetical protein